METTSCPGLSRAWTFLATLPSLRAKRSNPSFFFRTMDCFASFGLGLCIFALMPAEIGYQDIASLLARQPGVAERWQKRVFSAAGSIHIATFSFGRPIGTSSPQTATYRLASLDNQGIDITGSVTRNPLAAPPPRYQASDFPKVDRALKGDRLVVAPSAPAETPPAAAPANEDPSTSNASVMGAK